MRKRPKKLRLERCENIKQLTIGILAHVDAGKTALSESMLYASGVIGKAGRVDHGDAYLDTNAIERERGITIFSKQAIIQWEDLRVFLLDTPGHVDFSAEMERTLQVLDYAVLVISGADGVQGHTRTLWRLLRQYQIPTFIFVNKMDRPGTQFETLLQELKEKLSDRVVNFSGNDKDLFEENVAENNEYALNYFLENGHLNDDIISSLIEQQNIYPCYFGSALKQEGIFAFMNGLSTYTLEREYENNFGARVFKITRDEKGNRLTHLKVTGGMLNVRDLLSGENTSGETWQEKVNEIRIYSGENYEAIGCVSAGSICAVTGLSQTFAGLGMGFETELALPLLQPVLTYEIKLPYDCAPAVMLPKLKQLEEEEPELHIIWDEHLKELQAAIMGTVQMEVLEKLVEERFGVRISFGKGKVVYQETIKNSVEGVGHFEPLRHYAEVHLLLEPGLPGSGLEFDTDCSEDLLDLNWQRLIMTHLCEKEHKGVLTGSPITDMRITLVAGRAHKKHTEGGDFRQATYRAVRQGLRQAQSVLLEPYYEFRMELPESCVGRAMIDIEKMKGTFEAPKHDGDFAILCGSAPVSMMSEYQREFVSYTKGLGRLSTTIKGYGRCHNEEEVIEQIGYDAESDLANPTGSVFCAHGAGFIVSWDKVKDYMHIDQACKLIERELDEKTTTVSSSQTSDWMDIEEIDHILNQASYANKKSGFKPHKGIAKRTIKAKPAVNYKVPKAREKSGEKYLLVDGYNIIFAWEELSELSKINIDSARDKLMDIMCNYQGYTQVNLILVFDAYRVKSHPCRIFDYHNIHIVFTQEAETADQYIEKFAHENGKKHTVTVATSDRLEQIIIRGAGCMLMSAREFEHEVNSY